uniref:RAP domain-containing protein n=1 Tax=Tetradesmus obliquus TaxID=3088 RepID=A0A383VQ77_TETOB|eukprot:jgi/Sobl393_1/13955/SZX66902.1
MLPQGRKQRQQLLPAGQLPTSSSSSLHCSAQPQHAPQHGCYYQQQKRHDDACGSHSRDQQQQRPGGGQVFNPRQLTALIRDSSTTQQLAALIQQHFDSMDTIHLSAAITKLSRVGCRDPQLYAACVQRYLQFAPADSARNLSNIIYALCKAPADTRQQHQAALQQQLVPAFMDKVLEANAQEISNVVYGLAVSKQRLLEKSVQQLLTAFVAELQQANPQDMEQHVSMAQLQQLLGALVSMVQQAKPQNIFNTFWAVATMEQTVPAGHVQQLLDAFVSMLHQAKPQEVSNTLLACAKQSFLPQQLLAAPGLAGLLLAGPPQNLANAAWACSHLGHRDEQLMEALMAEVTQRLDAAVGYGSNSSGLNSQDCCNVCWAVAVLSLQQHAQQVLRLAQACSSMWSSTGAEDHWQLWQMHTWLLDFQLAGGQGLQGSLTEQQLQQCKATWDHNMRLTAKQRHTALQCSVFAAVRRLHLNWQQQPQMEQPSLGRDGVTPDGALLLDIAGRTAAVVLVAVEADGPTHFRQPDGGLKGPTQYRNRALAVRGYNLVSVPWWQWDELRGDAQRQQQYLMWRFGAAGVWEGNRLCNNSSSSKVGAPLCCCSSSWAEPFEPLQLQPGLQQVGQGKHASRHDAGRSMQGLMQLPQPRCWSAQAGQYRVPRPPPPPPPAHPANGSCAHSNAIWPAGMVPAAHSGSGCVWLPPSLPPLVQHAAGQLFALVPGNLCSPPAAASGHFTAQHTDWEPHSMAASRQQHR